MDLEKFVTTSANSTLPNDIKVTGSFTISGSISDGVNIRTFTIPINKINNLSQVLFRGRTGFGALSDIRPTDGWFEQGFVYAGADGSGWSNYPTAWQLSYTFSGTDIIITATQVQQSFGSLTLRPEIINYSIINYDFFTN